MNVTAETIVSAETVVGDSIVSRDPCALFSRLSAQEDKDDDDDSQLPRQLGTAVALEKVRSRHMWSVLLD